MLYPETWTTARQHLCSGGGLKRRAAVCVVLAKRRACSGWEEREHGRAGRSGADGQGSGDNAKPQKRAARGETEKESRPDDVAQGKKKPRRRKGQKRATRRRCGKDFAQRRRSVRCPGGKRPFRHRPRMERSFMPGREKGQGRGSYSSAETGSSHSLEVLSPGTSTARCANQLSLAAPCQCLTPAGMMTTSPGWSSRASLPHS